MSFTVFLGNLPVWVTADDIKSWLSSENLVADAVKVIRNPETQESKGFAFIESPNQEEMNSIIRRFDRAPLEDRFFAQIPPNRQKPAARSLPESTAARRRPPQASRSQQQPALPAGAAAQVRNNVRRPTATTADLPLRRAKAHSLRNWQSSLII